MALTKLNAATNNISSLQDLPNDDDGLTPEQLKAKFDKFGVDCKDYINNTLTTELDTNFATKTELANVVTGQIPDGTISIAKLNFDPATQVELDTVNTALTTHKTSNDHDSRYYTETETDTFLSGKVDKSILTASGDIPFATASGVWSKVTKGSQLQLFRVNAAGTGYEFSDTEATVTPSDVILLSAITDRSVDGSSGSSFATKKSFRVSRRGQYRIKFDLRSNTGGWFCHAQVLVNGVKVSTIDYTAQTTNTTFSFDTPTVQPNDLIEIQIKGDGGSASYYYYIKNAYVCGSLTTPTNTVVMD